MTSAMCGGHGQQCVTSLDTADSHASHDSVAHNKSHESYESQKDPAQTAKDRHSELPRADTSVSAVLLANGRVKDSIIEALKDTSEKQEYMRNHAQASTCLPSTSGGTHPALVLIRQKGLVCSQICKERAGILDWALKKISDNLKESGTMRWDDEDRNHDGRIDAAEFKIMLMREVEALSASGLVQEMSEEQIDVLMNFVPLDKDCLVADEQGVVQNKLCFVLVLWYLVNQFRDEWANLIQLPLRKVELIQSLTTLNKGVRVEMREALWIREKFWSISCEHDIDETKLLLCVAYWFTAPQARPQTGINRTQLILRIELERRLYDGLYRLVLWAGVFLLFAVSLIRAGKLEQCRGIKGNLEAHLDLGATSQVATMGDVIKYAKEFSKRSAALAPLSRVYFGGGSVWNLQDGLKTFAAPVPLPYLMYPDPPLKNQQPEILTLGHSFTLQAWVQFSGMALPRKGVSLLRKALDSDSSLSCWNWRFPPALSFGAHDYGHDAPNSQTGLMEEFVAAHYPPHKRKESNRSVLHTVMVTPTQVTFMVDGDVLGNYSLPRPITDCNTPDITLGDKGLTLAAVRFHPRDLSEREVRQVFRAGTTWPNIGFVVSPQKLQVMSETETMAKKLVEAFQTSEAAVQSNEDATWTAAALTSASMRSGPAATPYVNSSHSVPARMADPSIGYRYWEVYTKPVYTNSLSKNLAPGLDLPPLHGRTGFSLSAWIKVDSRTGNGFFMSLAMPRFDAAEEVRSGSTANPKWTGFDNMCWGIWVGADYTGFYAASGVPGNSDYLTYFVNDEQGPKAWRFTGKAYRHFVFQIAPQDSQRPLRVCIDGVCKGKAIDQYAAANLAGFPPAASCSQTGVMQSYNSSFAQDVLSQSRLYFNRRPLDNFPMVAWQMQTKYFDRVLLEAEVRKLFEEDADPSDVAGRPIRQTEGCKLPNELQDDPLFLDAFGNNCYWYFQNRRIRPAVCHDAAVTKACPVACEAFEICWGTPSAGARSTQIWRQQMELQTNGAHGTMCVAKSTTPEAEAIKCALNAPNFPNCHTLKARGELLDCGPRDCSAFAGDRAGLIQCLGNTRWVPDTGSRYDYFAPCKDIVLLAMPACTWDDTALAEIGEQIFKAKSWSISFWFESLRPEACAEPQIRFLGGDGGTFSWLGAMSGFSEDKQAGPGWLAGCSTEPWLSHGNIGATGLRGGTAGTLSADVPLPRLAPGSKHFVVIGRKDNSIGIHLDDLRDVQALPLEGLAPLQRGTNFLKVINIGGTIRMSSMTLRSYFPEVGEIGHMRFTSQYSQDVRKGPLRPLQEQLAETKIRKTTAYSQKTMLLMPPLLLQKRNRAGTCESLNIVSEIYKHGLDSQCTSPFKCDGFTERSIYACPLEEDATEEHFGHHPLTLGQNSYYMEYLASIADNSVLVRSYESNGSINLNVRKTDDFLDLLTKEATILAIFYSIEFKITTMLRIKFNTKQGKVLVKSQMQHFVNIQGSSEEQVVALLIIALIFLFLLVVDIVPASMKQCQVYRKTRSYHWPSLLESAGDACLGTVSFILILLQLLLFQVTDTTTEEFVKRLMGFDWKGDSHNSQDLASIKIQFMTEVSEIEDIFRRTTNMKSASTILSIVLMMRVVLCTSAHPRIELITKTIELALSDLMHFFALLVIIFFGFALLGTWMFGGEREEFGTVMAAFTTLCDSVLGPPGLLPINDTSSGPVTSVYTFLFHFVCFFFMLNFILAIIVDSYTRVMDGVRSCVVDQNILADVMSIFRYQYLHNKWKFPLRRVVRAYLLGLDQKVITLADLYDCDDLQGFEIFHSKEAANAFYKHYSKYPFLTDQVLEPDDPQNADLATLMAMTMHKVELLQSKLEEHKS